MCHRLWCVAEKKAILLTRETGVSAGQIGTVCVLTLQGIFKISYYSLARTTPPETGRDASRRLPRQHFFFGFRMMAELKAKGSSSGYLAQKQALVPSGVTASAAFSKRSTNERDEHLPGRQDSSARSQC